MSKSRLLLPTTTGGQKKIEQEPRDVAVYIAASLDDIVEARNVAKALRDQRVEVTSTWHELDAPRWDGTVSPDKDNKNNGGRIASQCLQEILRCDWLVAISTKNRSTSGGMHVEIGFAIGIRRQLILLGEPHNPFQCLPVHKKCGSIEELIMGLMTARVRAARMMQAHDDAMNQLKKGKQGSNG